MKRLLVLIALVLVASVVSCQQRYESPQAVAWDAPVEGFVDYYEVGIQPIQGGDVVVIASPMLEEQLIDLDSVGVYGVFVILVRAATFTEPDLYDYSDWIRSDNEAVDNTDVIWVDGEPQVFAIYLARPAGKPRILRIP